MSDGDPHAGVVLCGGGSRRMGADKALIEVGGVPMAARVAGALRETGATTVLAVGGDEAALAEAGLAVIADAWPGEGPLGGIVTALDATDASVLTVVACDLIEPSARSIGALLDAITADGACDVAVPRFEGQRQYDQLSIRRKRSHAVLRSAFADGVRSIRDSLSSLVVTDVEGLAPQTLRDADTPSDLPLR